MPDHLSTDSEPRKLTATLDENRIISTSYPFVWAELRANYKDAHSFILTSDFQDLNNLEPEKGGSASITSAKFEGIVPYNRTGTISLIDPTGAWAHNLVTVSAESNGYFGGNGPNIHIKFGWRGLKFGRESTEFIQDIEGLIISMEQDMTPEGLFTATIKFINYSSAAIRDIKFVKKTDMQWGVPGRLFNIKNDKNSPIYQPYISSNLFSVPRITPPGYYTSTDTSDKSRGEAASRGTARMGMPRTSAEVNEISNSDRKTNRKPQELLDIICNGKETNSDNFYFSIGKQLLNKNIKFIFNGLEQTKVVKQEMYPKIRFGDNLEDYIRDVIALMEPTTAFSEEAKEENYLLSYEKGIPTPYYSGGKGGIAIKYNWKKTPDESKDMSTNDWSEMYPKPGPELKLGPMFVYKYDGIKTNNRKLILNWTSDLSSHTYLIHLFQDELSEKFSSFTETDWTNLEDILEKEDVLTADSTIEAKADRIKRGISSGKDMTDNKNYKYYRSHGMIEAMNEVERALDGVKIENRTNSLRSVIMSNAFKANAVIMGDPAFGTTLPGGESEISTDFSSVGKLGDDVFSRRWLIIKTEHTFEDGKYTTNVELLGYPDNSEALALQRWTEYDIAMREKYPENED